MLRGVGGDSREAIPYPDRALRLFLHLTWLIKKSLSFSISDIFFNTDLGMKYAILGEK